LYCIKQVLIDWTNRRIGGLTAQFTDLYIYKQLCGMPWNGLLAWTSALGGCAAAVGALIFMSMGGHCSGGTSPLAIGQDTVGH